MAKKSTKKAVKKALAKRKKATSRHVRTGFPGALFAGETFFVDGRVSYPKNDELVEFLVRESAQVVETLSENVTMLFLGDSKRSKAEAKAKELNSKGAQIRIITDVEQLLKLDEKAVGAMLSDGEALERYLNLPPFLIGSSNTNLRKLAFGRQAIGPETGVIKMPDIRFEDTIFKNTTIRNLEVYRLQAVGRITYQRCKFLGARFVTTDFGSSDRCTFDKVKATDLRMAASIGLQAEHCHFKGLELVDLQEFDIGDTKIEGLRIQRDATVLSGKWTDCVISDSHLENDTRWQEISLTKMKLVGVRFRVDSHFDRCTLKNVEFKNCHFDGIEFEACNLTDCKFTNCTAVEMRFTKSRLRKIDAHGLKPDVIDVTDEQLKALKGLVI